MIYYLELIKVEFLIQSAHNGLVAQWVASLLPSPAGPSRPQVRGFKSTLGYC